MGVPQGAGGARASRPGASGRMAAPLPQPIGCQESLAAHGGAMGLPTGPGRPLLLVCAYCTLLRRKRGLSGGLECGGATHIDYWVPGSLRLAMAVPAAARERRRGMRSPIGAAPLHAAAAPPASHLTCQLPAGCPPTPPLKGHGTHGWLLIATAGAGYLMRALHPQSKPLPLAEPLRAKAVSVHGLCTLSVVSHH